MEIIVLFIIAALLVLGPRKGGRWPSLLTMGLGLFFLLWFLVVMSLGSIWNYFFGTMAQP